MEPSNKYACSQEQFNTICHQLNNWEDGISCCEFIKDKNNLSLNFFPRSMCSDMHENRSLEAKKILKFFHNNQNKIKKHHSNLIKKALEIKYQNQNRKFLKDINIFEYALKDDTVLNDDDKKNEQQTIKEKLIQEAWIIKQKLIDEARLSAEQILHQAEWLTHKTKEEIEELTQEKEKLEKQIADLKNTNLKKNCLIECQNGIFVTDISKLQDIPFFSRYLLHHEMKKPEIPEKYKKIFPDLLHQFDMKEYPLLIIKQFFQINDNPSHINEINNLNNFLELYQLFDRFDHPLRQQYIQAFKEKSTLEEMVHLLTILTYFPSDPFIQEICQLIALNFQVISHFPDFLKIKHEYLIEILNNDIVNVKNEFQLLQTVKKWMLAQIKHYNNVYDIFNQEIEGSSLSDVVRFEYIPYSKCKDVIKILPKKQKEYWTDFYYSLKKGIPPFEKIRPMRESVPSLPKRMSWSPFPQKNKIKAAIHFYGKPWYLNQKLPDHYFFRSKLKRALGHKWRITLAKSIKHQKNKIYLAVTCLNAKKHFKFKETNWHKYSLFDTTLSSTLTKTPKKYPKGKKICAYFDSSIFEKYINACRILHFVIKKLD